MGNLRRVVRHRDRIDAAADLQGARADPPLRSFRVAVSARRYERSLAVRPFRSCRGDDRPRGFPSRSRSRRTTLRRRPWPTMKHAHASRIDITSPHNGSVVLSIGDDGVGGADPALARVSSGSVTAEAFGRCIQIRSDCGWNAHHRGAATDREGGEPGANPSLLTDWMCSWRPRR